MVSTSPYETSHQSFQWVTGKGHIIFTLDQLLWLRALRLDLWMASSTCLKWWLGPMMCQAQLIVTTWFQQVHERSHQSFQWVTNKGHIIFTLDQLLWLRAPLDLLRASSTCLKWWLGPMMWHSTIIVLPHGFNKSIWDKSSVISMGHRQGSHHIHSRSAAVIESSSRSVKGLKHLFELMAWSHDVSSPTHCCHMVSTSPWEESSVISMGHRQGSHHILSKSAAMNLNPRYFRLDA